MRRLGIILGSLATLLAVLLPAATAQARTIGPRTTIWSGVTVSPTGSGTCQIAAQTVTFTVTGLTGTPRAAWTVTAIGETTDSGRVITLPLGTVTSADNGAKPGPVQVITLTAVSVVVHASGCVPPVAVLLAVRS
jgi:hypothetical protein